MSREGFRNFLSQYTAVGCYVQLSNLACFMEQWICYEVTTFRNTLCEHLQTEKILVNVLNSTQSAPCPAPCAASPVPVPAGIPEPAEAGALILLITMEWWYPGHLCIFTAPRQSCPPWNTTWGFYKLIYSFSLKLFQQIEIHLLGREQSYFWGQLSWQSCNKL